MWDFTPTPVLFFPGPAESINARCANACHILTHKGVHCVTRPSTDGTTLTMRSYHQCLGPPLPARSVHVTLSLCRHPTLALRDAPTLGVLLRFRSSCSPPGTQLFLHPTPLPGPALTAPQPSRRPGRLGTKTGSGGLGESRTLPQNRSAAGSPSGRPHSGTHHVQRDRLPRSLRS